MNKQKLQKLASPMFKEYMEIVHKISSSTILEEIVSCSKCISIFQNKWNNNSKDFHNLFLCCIDTLMFLCNSKFIEIYLPMKPER